MQHDFTINDSERPSHRDKLSGHDLYLCDGKGPVSYTLNMGC